MAIPSERETLRQALDDLAATPAPPPHRGDVALAEYCRRQLTHRRRSLGLLAGVIILAVGWITVRSGRARPWRALQPRGRHADRRAAMRDQYSLAIVAICL